MVIATFGSLGDLHPYLAVAVALQRRGHDTVVATGECYRGRVENLGLGFAPIRPDCDWVNDRERMRWLAHREWGLIRVAKMQLCGLRAAYEDTLQAAAGADLLVGNLAAYAVRLVAEKKGIAWAAAMHIPMLLFSRHDPPLLPGLQGLSRRLTCLGPRFWGLFASSLKWCMRGLAKPWYQLRRDLGLPAARDLNPLTDGHSPWLNLALYSPRMGDTQPDWPASTLVTGFPWFDQDDRGGLSPELRRFLDQGSPPIVFTLGTALAADPGQFFQDSAAAATLLGRRAILAGTKPGCGTVISLPSGIVQTGYVPFSHLFPQAAAVVHHGGIGTTGLAMRSGCPTLVVPRAWDQDDNARRAVRLGVARTLSRRRYCPEQVALELRHLLQDPAYARQASALAREVAREDGASVAADAVSALLQGIHQVRPGARLAGVGRTGRQKT